MALHCSLELNVEHPFHIGHLIVQLLRPFKCAVGLEWALTLRVLELDREIVADLINQDDCLLVEPFDALAILP